MAKYNDKTVKAFCDYIIEGENQKTAAEKLGISEVTICKWKKAYPEFLDKLDEAKRIFRETITLKLEKTLWKRAMGFEVTETEYEYRIEKNGQKVLKGEKIKTKHILPDTGALIFALTNVAPDKWKNRQRVETVDAKDVEKDEPRYNFDEVPRELLFKIADELQKGEHERIKQMSVKVLEVKTDEKKGEKTGNRNE